MIRHLCNFVIGIASLVAGFLFLRAIHSDSPVVEKILSSYGIILCGLVIMCINTFKPAKTFKLSKLEFQQKWGTLDANQNFNTIDNK